MARSISLEELVALNAEIAGLVRSGVPLELGLAGWGRNLPGKLGRVATQLGRSLAQGKSLAQSLDDSATRFPPVYGAIVRAGVRSGRLSGALESLAASARHLEEMRRGVRLALLYPMVLLLCAYLAFWLVTAQVMPSLASIYEPQPPALLAALAAIGNWANTPVAIPWTPYEIPIAWIPPLLFVAGVALVWLANRGTALLGGSGFSRALDWLPVVGRVVREARLAAVSEILGMLVEQGVALDEAVVLAAECTGDRRMIRSARSVAEALQQGGDPPPADRLIGFPPLLAWLVSSGGRQETFVAVARHVADTYRRRVARDTRWLRDYLPMWLIVVVGGGLVVVLGIAVFLPFSQLMQALGEQLGNAMRVRP